MEALTEDGAFSVDILVRREGIAVEVLTRDRHKAACSTHSGVPRWTSALQCIHATCRDFS